MSTRIIKLTAAAIWLTPDTPLLLAHTSLPSDVLGSLRQFNQDIYWEVQGQINIPTQQATLRVVNFIPDYEQIKSFHQARPFKAPIARVQFEPFEPALYQQWCARYSGRPAGFQVPDGHHYAAGTAAQPTPRTAKVSFTYPFSKAEFEDGGISGSYVHEGRPRPFRILNPVLRAEFGYIRPFITRILKKTFDVQLLIIDHPDGGPADIKASSRLIAQLDETLLAAWQLSRVQQVKGGSFEPGSEPEATLTLDELASQLLEAEESAPLLPVDVLQELLIKTARNRIQLAYLASRHTLSAPVRFTFGHDKGFIFSVRSATYHYYCWELLDKNATYVWRFPLAPDPLPLLELQLRAVTQSGRMTYRTQYGTKNSAPEDASWFFTWIEHTLLEQTPEQTFALWKAQVSKVLV